MLSDVGEAVFKKLRIFLNSVPSSVGFDFGWFDSDMVGYLTIREHAVCNDEIDLLLCPAVVHRHCSHSNPY